MIGRHEFRAWEGAGICNCEIEAHVWLRAKKRCPNIMHNTHKIESKSVV